MSLAPKPQKNWLIAVDELNTLFLGELVRLLCVSSPQNTGGSFHWHSAGYGMNGERLWKSILQRNCP